MGANSEVVMENQVLVDQVTERQHADGLERLTSELLALRARFSKLQASLLNDVVYFKEANFQRTFRGQNPPVSPNFQTDIIDKLAAAVRDYQVLTEQVKAYIPAHEIDVMNERVLSAARLGEQQLQGQLYYNLAYQMEYQNAMRPILETWTAQRDYIRHSFAKRTHQEYTASYCISAFLILFGVGFPMLIFTAALHTIDAIVTRVRERHLTSKINSAMSDKPEHLYANSLKQSFQEKIDRDKSATLRQGFFNVTKMRHQPCFAELDTIPGNPVPYDFFNRP